MRIRIGRFALAFVLSGVALLTFASPADVAGECASCHEDVATAFGTTVHGKAFGAYQTATCASCHIGGQEHAASGGEQKPVSVEKTSEGCLSCHDGKGAQTHWQGSAHEMAGVACASCHRVHANRGGTPAAHRALGGPSEVTQRCLDCHGGQRAALHQRSSHPLRNGQMDCASCHNPHGSTGEKLLRHASVNELCYSCHQNVRGPFLWEHSPVREDCLTCHKAHGSNYPQLLQARVTQLCQSCHQQGRHQTVAGVPSAIWVAGNACVTCHSQVHGSNHPSGPLFQR
jgi:DmsE family decaheme c-type cytochrome